jgi:streptogramin lyase
MSFKIAKVEKRFKSPGPQPNGLQATADGLWCIDQVDNKVYLQDYATGKVLFAADTDTVHSSGITFGGGYMWIASTYERKIAKLDPATGKTVAKYDSPGNGIVAWREGAPDAGPTGAHGLEWRDGKLYVAAPPSQLIHVMDPESWQEVHSFRAPGLRVHGLAWGEKGRLWVADTSNGTVSLLGTEDGRVYEVIRVEAPAEVHGLTIHEGVLWYCDAHSCDMGRLLVED